jgi:CelD/BcsL family acetyltransferase involved in cellulose biosynthesis
MLTELRSNLRPTRRRPEKSDRPRARTNDDLDALEASWPSDALLHGGPSTSFAWMRAARLAFAEGEEVQVLAAEANHRVLAATALVGSRRHGLRRQSPLGMQLGEPIDLAGREVSGLRCLADALIRTRQLIRIDRMARNSPAIDALRQAAFGRAIAIERPANSYPYLRLDESWIAPERYLPSLERKRLARARRRAERIGRVSVEIHTPDLNELPCLLDLAFDLEAGSPQSTDDDEASLTLGQNVFFRQYAEAACMDGALRICLLRIGDHVAATQVGVESDDTFWLLKAGVDPRFSRSQPAQLLAREVLKYAAEANLRTFALWGARHTWMLAWPLAARACVSLNVYPLGIRGAAALLADTAVAGYRGLKRLRTRMKA